MAQSQYVTNASVLAGIAMLLIMMGTILGTPANNTWALVPMILVLVLVQWWVKSND